MWNDENLVYSISSFVYLCNLFHAGHWWKESFTYSTILLRRDSNEGNSPLHLHKYSFSYPKKSEMLRLIMTRRDTHLKIKKKSGFVSGIRVFSFLVGLDFLRLLFLLLCPCFAHLVVIRTIKMVMKLIRMQSAYFEAK